jgi:nitrogen fixation protein NifB
MYKKEIMGDLGRANKDVIKEHPCFTEVAHTRFSRAHLSVAPACNIQCRYCIRKFDCANESRPGITSRVLTPEEAVERTRALVDRSERLGICTVKSAGCDRKGEKYPLTHRTA